MKKYLFLVICFAVLGISQAKAQAAKVALQHDGNVTLFNADELQKALDASVDGDIIYLNEGTFRGYVTISKKVSVIGAGENTTIDGSLTVKSDGVLVDALQIRFVLELDFDLVLPLDASDLHVGRERVFERTGDRLVALGNLRGFLLLLLRLSGEQACHRLGFPYR